jgi:hypothetical protein
MTVQEALKEIDDYKRSLGIIPGKEWYEKEMARQKASLESRFADLVKEIGIQDAEKLLKFLKQYENKKSLGTDPDPKAGERTNEPPNTTPAE